MRTPWKQPAGERPQDAVAAALPAKAGQTPSSRHWLLGVGFTFVVAILGYALAQIPGFDRVGQLACAILIAIAYRQIWGYPESIRSGIQFSAKRLLRLAIILYGLKLNINVVLHEGLGLLLYDAGVIVFAIGLTLLIAKSLKADMSLSMLLGVGTGVCGAAAIAAVSPIIKAKDEDTAIGVGIIALVGTVFAVAYTLVRPLLPLSPLEYGTWSGVSLHEIAHVALAAAPAGDDGLAIGLLAKLGRVLLLVPLCFLLMVWMKKTGKVEGAAKIEFPWFLIGFIAMSVIGSYVLGGLIPVSDSFHSSVASLTTFVLTMAMVGLGLNVNLRDMRTKAAKPLIAMAVTSVLLSGLTFLLAIV
ncbi:putative sulfate exporter family transporter [Brevibacillus composti]|uniref:Sulfate exporter family transporter n=1 Tax=Brevibacillus composti TaxID=2796470 RepID=A0A7T5EKP5_9BACL|nr:putative sulfate exporter family transporter [Brevibacillus composti]QQE74328.1 putative sulfate exporter family transporter [Brevibacillus composti]QUO41410.1 putative sulfate exporter family transporter [Brevibacillus composti]